MTMLRNTTRECPAGAPFCVNGNGAEGDSSSSRTAALPVSFTPQPITARRSKDGNQSTAPVCREKYCEAHQPQRFDGRRNAAARGYDRRWARFRAWYLAQPEHQFCALHISPRCKGLAECIDHIVPLNGPDDPGRFDLDNLQPACLACNTAKGRRIIRGTWRYGVPAASPSDDKA